ncbi:hypothetical protein KP509_30G013700 [Ceratopteris richardii]|uniref:serine O-acetyltransferase n=1 Tax=Ceratopteris richardii TaxID=49495 RepID=A0A8T2R1T6_CERRI|nr:hypothetical protein KP509_30G013700 [Ceratopteris richardii]
MLQLDHVWDDLRHEALEQLKVEPHLASYLYATVLVHPSLERSLAFHLANKLASSTLLSSQLFTLFRESLSDDIKIQEAIRADIKAFRERDPACMGYVHAMLNYKEFLACEAHRITHTLWDQGRFALAIALQNRISEVFHVDIHPGAQIGKGVLFDHATGVVIGETAVIGNNVSILHHVTLGGTGNCSGIRHPRIGDGVLLGAGAILLGSITVGDGTKVGACSLVLTDVPPHTTVVGVPARRLNPEVDVAMKATDEELPALSMDHTSSILNYTI